ncbi:hypothetical protein G7Z17_g6401 [Cylindrodendrum hubeiense]|uniref:Uncharacterized protein n=1 Tax=Cylindrodendrum hubeiense TaxID=595255 RepID=A0A9P5H9Y0_9HYPO|nr:hypothetical protein G7Z17_g6401 [Cylindrodendrum hubeiense]
MSSAAPKIESLPFIDALALATANKEVRKAVIARARSRSQCTLWSRQSDGKRSGREKSHKKKSDRKKSGKKKKSKRESSEKSNTAEAHPHAGSLNENSPWEPISCESGLHENNSYTANLYETRSCENILYSISSNKRNSSEPTSAEEISDEPSSDENGLDSTYGSNPGRGNWVSESTVSEKPDYTLNPEPKYLSDKTYYTLKPWPEPQPEALPEKPASQRSHYIPKQGLVASLEFDPEPEMNRAVDCSAESGVVSTWPRLASSASTLSATSAFSLQPPLPPLEPLALPQATFSEESQLGKPEDARSVFFRLKTRLKPSTRHLQLPPSPNVPESEVLDTHSIVGSTAGPDDMPILSRGEYSYDPGVDALYAHIPRQPGQHFPGELVVNPAATGWARPRIEAFPQVAPPRPPKEKPISVSVSDSEESESRYMLLQDVSLVPHGHSEDDVSAWCGEVRRSGAVSRQEVRSLVSGGSTVWPGMSSVAEEGEDDGIDLQPVAPEDSASCVGWKSAQRRGIDGRWGPVGA